MSSASPPDPLQQSLRFERALLGLDRLTARAALLGDAPLGARLEAVVVPALDRIGAAWERGDVALSQVYMAGRIAEELVGELAPPPVPGATPRVALALLEDHHQLGKRMVASMLAASGIEVADLGRTTVDELVRHVEQKRFEVLLVSVLMLASARRVGEVVARVSSLPWRVRVLVGGAPFRLDPTLAARVGAHGWGASAGDAVRLVTAWQRGEP
ncbi:MAG: cobalamin B12-binding domain-containing protein [Myxococcota bacterium]